MMPKRPPGGKKGEKRAPSPSVYNLRPKMGLFPRLARPAGGERSRRGFCGRETPNQAGAAPPPLLKGAKVGGPPPKSPRRLPPWISPILARFPSPQRRRFCLGVSAPRVFSLIDCGRRALNYRRGSFFKYSPGPQSRFEGGFFPQKGAL